MTYVEFITSSELDTMLNDKDVLTHILTEPYTRDIESVTSESIFSRIMADPNICFDVKRKVFDKVDYYFGSYEDCDINYKQSITLYKNICWLFASNFLDIKGFKDIINPMPIAGIKSADIALEVRQLFSSRIKYFYKYDEEQRLRKNAKKQNEDTYTRQRNDIIHFYKRYLLTECSEIQYCNEIDAHTYYCSSNVLDRTQTIANAKTFIQMSETLLNNVERIIKDFELERIFNNYQTKHSIVNPLNNKIIVKKFEKFKYEIEQACK